MLNYSYMHPKVIEKQIILQKSNKFHAKIKALPDLHMYVH